MIHINFLILLILSSCPSYAGVGERLRSFTENKTLEQKEESHRDIPWLIVFTPEALSSALISLDGDNIYGQIQSVVFKPPISLMNEYLKSVGAFNPRLAIGFADIYSPGPLVYSSVDLLVQHKSDCGMAVKFIAYAGIYNLTEADLRGNYSIYGFCIFDFRQGSISLYAGLQSEEVQVSTDLSSYLDQAQSLRPNKDNVHLGVFYNYYVGSTLGFSLETDLRERISVGIHRRL